MNEAALECPQISDVTLLVIVLAAVAESDDLYVTPSTIIISSSSRYDLFVGKHSATVQIKSQYMYTVDRQN